MSLRSEANAARIALTIAARSLQDKATARFQLYGPEDVRGAAIWDSAWHIDPFGANVANIPPPDPETPEERTR
jgi:hypothetical protein